MAAVTKGSGRYFYDFERVWTETRETGMLPFWVGQLPRWLNLPVQPNPHVIQALADGRAYLGHVQANRVGCYDLTVSFGKSISLLTSGLAPPGEWKGWTELLAKVATAEVEKLVNNQLRNSGPQGRDKVPSAGVAVGFGHRESYRGDPHRHFHYAILNLTQSKDGKLGSIANARDLFEKQGVVRARVNKGLDDELQARGYDTVRVGKKVELARVPKELLEEISPARRAMNRAREEKQFSGPKAHDFYARQARRDAGARVHKTPEETHRDCKELAARHGVTLDSLKRDPKAPAPARDPASEMSTAHRVAREAVSTCAKKHGSFTADQFFERLYTLGIGKPTTLQALDAMGQAVLKDRSIAGVQRRKLPDGTERYTARESQRVTRSAERPYRGDTKEAWEELKGAVKGLGNAAFVATAKKATAVAQQLSEIVNPPPRTLTVDASWLSDFIDKRRPTPYLLAHAKAILSGLKAWGNPHERAGVAEKTYEQLRSYERLPKNSVVIVRRGSLASARELHLLNKIARRDKASVILSERDAIGLQKLRQMKHGARKHNREL